MKLKALYLSAIMACLCGVTTSQTPLKTYSVYDVNHNEETSVTDATLVVSRAVQRVTDDPQIVDATLLNKVLQEINSKLQLLESMNARLEAIEKKDTDKPNTNGHEYVDLGMTDANGNPVYWATCNIGAATPEDYGWYFAWGDTKGYGSVTSDGHSFDWSNYKWCNGSNDSQTKYCTHSTYGTVDNKTALETEDDAVHVNWGGVWRMPTIEELMWLRYNCTWTWDSSKKGSTVTSKKTGKSIFLPAAGNRYDSNLNNAGSNGYYWSMSLGTSGTSDAYGLSFDSVGQNTANGSRFVGRSVRAVCVLSE